MKNLTEIEILFILFQKILKQKSLHSRKEYCMESYKEFLERINSFENKELHLGNEYFGINPSVHQKVNDDNTFKTFYGDTIVFNLTDTEKELLTHYVEQLYNAAPECFCEKLISNTYHMTLHDLSNSPNLSDIAAEMFHNELRVIYKRNAIKPYKIKMKSKYIFNMVNTSLVLGLYPTDEYEYHKLMELYFLFDEVKQLSYPLTPHITLAYYNSHGFGTESARKLEQAVNRLNLTPLEFELDVKNLYYQKFRSMNDYINIFCLGSL